MHGNVDLAEIGTKELLALIFWDLYTSADDSKVTMKFGKVMIERNTKKQPDFSLNEVECEMNLLKSLKGRMK